MSSNKRIGNLFAFLGLIIIVLIMALNTVTGWLKVDLGVISQILDWAQRVSILLAIGIGGYEYTLSANKTIKLIFWTAVILYIVFMFV